MMQEAIGKKPDTIEIPSEVKEISEETIIKKEEIKKIKAE